MELFSTSVADKTKCCASLNDGMIFRGTCPFVYLYLRDQTTSSMEQVGPKNM